MRSTVCLLILALLGAAAPLAAQAGKPRSLEDIALLVRSGVSSGRIVELVNRDCVSFSLDAGAARRLADMGATSSLLAALRSACVQGTEPAAAQPERPAAPPERPAAGGGAAAPYGARATRLAFFERGLQAPPLRQRVLALRFPQATTRYVGIMVDLAYSPPQSTVRLPLVCTYLKPNGEVLGTTELRMVLSSSGSANDAGAVGFDQPGEWRRGTYGVVCALDGVPVGRATFTVE